MIYKWTVFLFAVLFSSFSCKTTQQNFTESDLIISLERTPCFGKCPIYIISIDKNGIVQYNAKKFCDTTGVFCFKLSDSELKNLKRDLKNIDFQSISGKYPENTVIPADLPSVRLTLVQKKIRKLVVIQGGGKGDVPQILKDIVEKMDSFKEKSIFYKCMAN